MKCRTDGSSQPLSLHTAPGDDFGTARASWFLSQPKIVAEPVGKRFSHDRVPLVVEVRLQEQLVAGVVNARAEDRQQVEKGNPVFTRIKMDVHLRQGDVEVRPALAGAVHLI